MTTLLIDIETYSSVDIAKAGVNKYVESDDFAVLLFSYSVDLAPAIIVDLAMGEEIPMEIRHACYDPSVVKIAHNMSFEITCLSKHFGQPLSVEQWSDTMIMCAYLALPLSLDQAGKILRLDQQKSATGKNLINTFSKPNSRTGKRVMPTEKIDKWDAFKAYCLQDVDTEVALYKKVSNRIIQPQWEQDLVKTDYIINQRGVRIDTRLAENACKFWDRYSAEMENELKAITGLENPNSVLQLRDWLKKKGCLMDSLDKVSVSDKLKGYLLSSVRRVLEIRQELGKSSVKKYKAMLEGVCADGRARGITQYYGACSTGRWAGRRIQTQNLPQNHIADLSYARSLLYEGDYEGMEMSYHSISDTLSQLIRTALIPSEGRIFHICDFSAIECRVLAWLAGEQWVLDVFKKGGDIYCATASNMFGVPVEKHGANSELRQKGKISTLALGYQGGLGALRTMGGERMGLTEPEMKEIVGKWRKANPNIVKFWQDLESAARKTIVTGLPTRMNRGISFSMRFGWMIVTLPSGRSIGYPRCRLEEYNGEGLRITYERMNQETHKWERIGTYGGKLAENVTQAIARDILATVILRCEKAGLPIVFHVHDEVIIDSPKDRSLQEVEQIFGEPISWAEGLPLKGAGYSGEYYYKD